MMIDDLDPADVLATILRQDLSSFIQRAFAVVDPGATYRHGWHVAAIASHLEQVARGEIKRLIITMPPRSLKSIAASIAFPAWLLGHDPRRQIVAVSLTFCPRNLLSIVCGCCPRPGIRHSFLQRGLQRDSPGAPTLPQPAEADASRRRLVAHSPDAVEISS
jgi:hypothetical protein